MKQKLLQVTQLPISMKEVTLSLGWTGRHPLQAFRRVTIRDTARFPFVQHNLLTARDGALSAFDISAFAEAAQAQLQFDRFALAILDTKSPRPEGFLAVRGVSARDLHDWCQKNHHADPLWKKARRTCQARGAHKAGDSGPPLPGVKACMACGLPASLDGRRRWYLAVGRRDKPYTREEQRRASLLLRLTQVEFDHVSSVGDGRMVLDRNDQLIHADPRTEARLAANPTRMDELRQTLRQVIQQRWPEDRTGARHDMVIQVAGQPTWVRFRSAAAATDLSPTFYVETHEVHDDALPAAGVVEDGRIARALGYLSDHLADKPTLRQAAQAAGLSEFHFHRLFTRTVGVSPKQFLLQMQVQAAKWLLRSSHLSVGEVAAAAGFTSHGHFTATFHRLVGRSPSRYREGT